ncbi:MAG: hypothetical protein JOZ41_04695, partial [Chloroflexi bacterium]|nr:hypothetical protein [Chloroflexota bacterium]
HPKIQQYLRSSAGSVYAHSKLQVILSAISQHVRGVAGRVPSVPSVTEALAGLEEDEAEDQTPSEEEDEVVQRRCRSSEQRVRAIIRNFLRQYFRGIRSAEFQELVGYEIVVINYVIVQHILWTLFSKEWMDPRTVIESLQEMWSFFWGDTERDGYFDLLTSDQQMQAAERIDAQHADVELLASLYHAAYVTRIGRWDDLRVGLRDSWRQLLFSPALVVTTDVLVGASRLVRQVAAFNPPTPVDIAAELHALANLETRRTFMNTLLQRLHLARGTARFERQRIFRKALGRDAEVDCLMLEASEVLSTLDEAADILREWRRFEELDYYRIQARNGKALIYYDAKAQRATYQSPEGDRRPLNPEDLSPASADWDIPLRQLRQIGMEASETIRREQALAG